MGNGKQFERQTIFVKNISLIKYEQNQHFPNFEKVIPH